MSESDKSIDRKMGPQEDTQGKSSPILQKQDGAARANNSEFDALISEYNSIEIQKSDIRELAHFLNPPQIIKDIVLAYGQLILDPKSDFDQIKSHFKSSNFDYKNAIDPVRISTNPKNFEREILIKFKELNLDLSQVLKVSQAVRPLFEIMDILVRLLEKQGTLMSAKEVPQGLNESNKKEEDTNTTNLNLQVPSKSMDTSGFAQKDASNTVNLLPQIRIKAINLDLNTSLSADTTIQQPKTSNPLDSSSSQATNNLGGDGKISIPSHQFSLNSTPAPQTTNQSSHLTGVGNFTITPSENNKKLSGQSTSSINISPQSMTFNQGLSPPRIKIDTNRTNKDTLNSNNNIGSSGDMGFGSDLSAPIGSIKINPGLFKLDPLPAQSAENFRLQDSLAGSSQQNLSVKIQTPTLGPNSLKLSTAVTNSIQKSEKEPQSVSIKITPSEAPEDNPNLNLEGLTDESDDLVQTEMSPTSKPKTSGSGSSKSNLKPVELKSKSSSFIQNTQRLLDNPLLGKQQSKTSMASSSEEKDQVTPLHKTQSLAPNMMRNNQFDDCKFNESFPKQFQFSTYSAAAKIIEKLYSDLQHAVRIAKEYRQDFLTLQAFVKEHFKSLDLVLKNRVVNQLDDQRTFKVLKSCFDETPTVGMTFASPLVTKTINPTSGEEQVAPLPLLDFAKEFKGALSGIRETQNAINVKVLPATLEKFTDILMHKPIGLHFTGHGVENSMATLGQQSFLLSNQGNCLIFENQDGSAHYISQSQIKDLFQMHVSSLKFVFIATCHSEFAGEIFHNAGVDHVICVRQKDTLLDDAAIFFTKKFYQTLFSEKYTICEAFNWAKISLRNHPDYEIQQEADKIIMLLDTDKVAQCKDPEKKNRGGLDLITDTFNFSSKKKKHVCAVLGPFRKREHELIEQKFVYPFDGGKVTDFVGRQREMQEIIACVLSNRFTTVIGVPGIGKTTIAKSVGSHFDERKAFEDGVIFFSMRGKDQTTHLVQQMFLFFNKFSQNQPNSQKLDHQSSTVNQQQTNVSPSTGNGQEKEDSSAVNGPAPPANQTNPQANQNSQNMEESIFSFLGQKQVLIILDNLEDVLRQDDENLRIFLSTLLTRLPLVSLLTTSRQKVSSLGEIAEKSYELNSLTNNFTIQLLEKKALREIKQSEIDELFQIDVSQKIKAVDFESRKSEANIPKNGVKNLEDHHLLALLGGHPHAVSLIAPFLQNDRSLSDLYRLLVQMTESGDFMKDMSMIDPTHSLKISMDTSTLHLRQTQPEALSLFCLLGMLPGGVSERDLPTLWRSSEVIVTCEILRRASLVVVRTEQRVLETKAKGVKTYRLLPFMNKYAESLLSPFDRLRKHNQCVEFLLEKCLEIFVKCNAEEYRGIQDQLRIQLLEIETNLWSCIYRVCDLNRERNEAKELDRRANRMHQQNMTGYSSAADEFEAVLLSRTHISINNLDSEDDSESGFERDTTFQLSNNALTPKSQPGLQNFSNNINRIPSLQAQSILNNPAQPSFGFNRKNNRGSPHSNPDSTNNENSNLKKSKVSGPQDENSQSNNEFTLPSQNPDDYSFQNPEEISFKLNDSNQNTYEENNIKDILSGNASQENISRASSDDGIPQYKQTKQVSFMLKEEGLEEPRSKSALGQQPQAQGLNRLNESIMRKNANSGLSAPRRGSQRTNEKPFNTELSQIEVASKGMTDSDTLNVRSFGFLQNKTDPDNFDAFSGEFISAASIQGSIRDENEMLDHSLESPTRFRNENKYFGKLQRSNSLMISPKKNQFSATHTPSESGNSNHSFGPKTLIHRRSLVVKPNEMDHLTENSRRKSTKSVKNIGVALLDDLYLSDKSDISSNNGKMARKNLFCKSERLVNDIQNVRDSLNEDFSPTSPQTNALDLSFNVKTKSNKTKRSVEADSSLQNEGSKTVSSGQILNQTILTSEQNQSAPSPKNQLLKSTLNNLNRISKISKHNALQSSSLKTNLETIQERGEMAASSRLIVIYVSILILIHSYPEAIRVIDLVLASHVHDSLLKANLKRLKAIALMKQNNLSVKEAYSQFKDAATLFEKIGNKSKTKEGSEQNLGVAQNLFGMGLLMFQKTFNFVTQKFDETKCLKKAETFLQEAYDIYKNRDHLAGQVICLQKLAMVRKKLQMTHINLFQESRKLSQLLNNQLRLQELKKKEASKFDSFTQLNQQASQYILRQDGHEISVLISMIDLPHIFQHTNSSLKPRKPASNAQKPSQKEKEEQQVGSKQKGEKRQNPKSAGKKSKPRISAHQITPQILGLSQIPDNNQSPNDSCSEGSLSPAFNRKSGKTFASQEREQVSKDHFRYKIPELSQPKAIELNQVAFQSQDSSTETGSNQNVAKIKGKKGKKPRVQLNNFLSEESQEEKEAAPPSYQTNLALPEIDEVPIQRRQQQIQLSKAEDDILKAKMQYQNKIQQKEEMQNKLKTNNLEKQMARKKKNKKGKAESPKASMSLSSSKNISAAISQQEEQKTDSPETLQMQRMESQGLDFDEFYDDLDIPIASQGSFLSNSIQFEKSDKGRRHTTQNQQRPGRKSSIVSNNSMLSFSEQSDGSQAFLPQNNNNYFQPQQQKFDAYSAASSDFSSSQKAPSQPREEDFEFAMQQQAIPQPIPQMRQKLTDLLQIGGGGGDRNRNEVERESSNSFKNQRRRPTKYDHVESKVKSFITNQFEQNLSNSVPLQPPSSAAQENKKKSPLLPSKQQESKSSIFGSAPIAQKSYQDKVAKISKTSLTKETVQKETKEEKEKAEPKMASSITSALKSRVNKGVQQLGKSLFGSSKQKKSSS